MSMTYTPWKENDIFFWRYKDELGYHIDRYWCCSQKAVVRHGTLCDTYWMRFDGDQFSSSGEGRHWSFAEADKTLNLEFQGNLADFELIPSYMVPYYNPSDVLDLRHANSSRDQCYCRKGVARSRDAMTAHVTYLIEKEQSAIRSAQWRLERIAEEKAKIEAGDLENVSL